MPTPKDSTTQRRYAFSGGQVFLYEGRRVVEDVCGVARRSTNAEEREMAKRIADALNAAEANRDRPWTDDGPAVAEVGESILVRIGDDLVRGRWNHTLGAWLMEGNTVEVLQVPPTGWRPMPGRT